eukprot:2260745-Pleurochrysis_carterae.AAC.1
MVMVLPELTCHCDPLAGRRHPPPRIAACRPRRPAAASPGPRSCSAGMLRPAPPAPALPRPDRALPRRARSSHVCTAPPRRSTAHPAVPPSMPMS